MSSDEEFMDQTMECVLAEARERARLKGKPWTDSNETFQQIAFEESYTKEPAGGDKEKHNETLRESKVNKFLRGQAALQADEGGFAGCIEERLAVALYGSVSESYDSIKRSIVRKTQKAWENYMGFDQYTRHIGEHDAEEQRASTAQFPGNFFELKMG